MAARIAQHEFDHLDGKLMIDRTTPEARREAMAALRPRLVLVADAEARRRGDGAVRRGRPRAARRATTRSRALLTRPDAPRGRGRKTAAPPAKETAERLGIRVLQPDAARAGARARRRHGRRRRVRAAHPRVGARRAALAQRASVAAAALARRRARRARDHGRRRRDRRHDPPDGQGARRRPDRRAARVPDRRADDAGAVYANAARDRGRAARRRARRSRSSRRSPRTASTYAEKITAGRPRARLGATRRTSCSTAIRALSPHIGARAELHGRPVTIWKARVAGGRLEPLEVQPDGRRRMTYDEFLRGLR